MNLTIDKYNGLNLLIAEGTVEEESLHKIAEELDKLPSHAVKYVLVDCTGLKKLIHNRIGFSAFINHLLLIKSKQARITLFGCDHQVQKLMRLLKLDTTFHFSQNLDEAYLNLNKLFTTAPSTGTATSNITYA